MEILYQTPDSNNTDNPQLTQAYIIATFATFLFDVHNLLETNGSLTWALARLEKRTPDGEVLNAILARLSEPNQGHDS